MTRSPKFRVLATAFACALVFAACSEDEEATTTTAAGGSDASFEAPATIADGKLTACSDIPYAPFQDVADDGTYTGFDVELVTEMGKLGELEVEFIDVEFDGILGNLAAGNCDLIASALTINDERAQQVDFTDPYYDSLQSLMVKKDGGATSLEEFSGVLAVQSGTTGETFATENAPDGVEVKAFDGADAMFIALEGGDVQGILQDLPVNVERARSDDTLTIVEDFDTEEQYGFAVEKGNAEMLAFLNATLAELKENGTYQTIYDSYFAVSE